MAFLSLVIFTSLSANAFSFPTKVTPSRCLSALTRLGISSATGVSLVGAIALGLTGGSELAGHLHETPHVGLSVYLDYENILTYLDPSDRAEFTKKKTNTLSIATILVRLLSIKEGDSAERFPYLKPIMASSYFDDSEVRTNMCRHKALIMRGILNHLNIKAELMTGTVDAESGRGEHVWLYIPSINQMADPMNNMVLSPDEFEKRFHPEVYKGVIHWAKPLGIIGR